MTLEYYANLAEIFGVIIVVITLIFLALQIRQNTRALRSTTLQAVMHSDIAIAAVFTEHAATWEKVVSASELAPGEETRKAITIFNIFMIDTENRFHQCRDGHLDSQTWEARRGVLPSVVSLPLFKLWRVSLGGQCHSADFLELLDEIYAQLPHEEAAT